LLTCCGRVRRLLKRALRRMSSSCLHQRLLWLLEVDPSTTTGAADASRLQRELREVASGTKWEMRRAGSEAATCIQVATSHLPPRRPRLLCDFTVRGFTVSVRWC